MMRKLLPFPLLSVAVLTMWVLLTGFSPGHLVLGSIIALIIPRVMLTLGVEKPRLRPTWSIFKLAGLIFVDILRSNIAVARIVLFKPASRASGFIELPITLKSPYALSTLAVIISATPGTLWLQHDLRRNIILIHVLDIVDEQSFVDLVQNRYERLLKDIFE